VDTGRFQDGPAGAAGDHPGTGGRGLEQDAAGAVLAHDLVRDGRTGQRDRNEVLLRLLDALLDGGGDLFGLAEPQPDLTLPVADDHQGREREPPAALDDLRDPADLDDPLLVLAVGRRLPSLPATASSLTSHP
jgi:hypothetical protein